MNFDYQQTQAEVTYQQVGLHDWAFKQVAQLVAVEGDADVENASFDSHCLEMRAAGWALVSIANIAGSFKLNSTCSSDVSQTSNYQLSWKRVKAPQG